MNPLLEEIRLVEQQALLLHSEAEVEAALDNMAAQINRTLADSNLLVLCVINGGIIAAGKLLPRLNFPLTLDSIHASRYRNATSGSDIHWLYKPTTSLAGRSVLIVDDILDEGHTLQAIADYCLDQGAQQVFTAVLFDKQLDREKPVSPDFVGLTVANHYLFGYGMDYKGYLRNAAGVYACKDVL
ncbi:hypoxanthine-guanine phosphoribosyltransferase [Methylomonas koyamae]|uniref:Hypoxanthine-guanine phosphoribosyltransferase n=1 Tax=Methylomonas koyamae TaxID=702114 RepID=A0A177N330_9GAMM|nr:hypoxanthine-guanine phosphoribosyltransferase [Methylomonas koyamae]OAI12261.1 hypoxanthine-guanine phosphoribosyltransferase [Methylomonas koyamae]